MGFIVQAKIAERMPEWAGAGNPLPAVIPAVASWEWDTG